MKSRSKVTKMYQKTKENDKSDLIHREDGYWSKHTEYTRNWRKKNPEKYKAHNTVNNAIRAKRLKRGTCEVCGSEKVHAHHDDYSKPLDVRWLCVEHHGHTRRKDPEHRKVYY